MPYESLALHTDKYQINMMYAHWKGGTGRLKAVFECYFRELPFGNGYAVFAGLERIVNYMKQLTFGEDEINYLKEQEEHYDLAFLEELRRFRFTGNLWSAAEGSVVFPNEPLIRIEAPIFEAQLLETAILNFMNYQTLIATKAARIRQVALHDTLLEFGTRRAQEADAAIWGARSAYIAGFDATSNLRAGMLFGMPVKGTHSHAWVQNFDTELEAFDQFSAALPDQVTLLVDTYDTLKCGIPHAILAAKRLQQQGKRMQAIRLDSGDLAYLSKQARSMLDDAGLPYVKIVASNDLDEQLISELKKQGAAIDIWGIGTKLITAADQPALGGVCKMVARERNGETIPVIKISSNPDKVSFPGIKNVYRIINNDTDKAEADFVALQSEENIPYGHNLELFNPAFPYLKKKVIHYSSIPVLQQIFNNGELVYRLPDLRQIRLHHQEQLALYWPEYLRMLNPQTYPVNFSTELWQLRLNMIEGGLL